MAVGDLTSLNAVKGWLGLTNTEADTNLQVVISGVSGVVKAYIERYNLLSTVRTEIRNGNGNSAMVLREWPVTSIEYVLVGQSQVQPQSINTVGGISIPQGAGYALELWDGNPPGCPQSIYLAGQNFEYGQANIQVKYTAGYLISAEPGVAATTYQVLAPQGSWAGDNGVVFTDTGASATFVAGAPARGQYSYSSSYPGQYTLNALDVGRPISVSYSFIPRGLEQIVIEEVVERWGYKGRVGQKTKSIGGQETVAYELAALSQYVMLALQPYKSVLVP